MTNICCCGFCFHRFNHRNPVIHSHYISCRPFYCFFLCKWEERTMGLRKRPISLVSRFSATLVGNDNNKKPRCWSSMFSLSSHVVEPVCLRALTQYILSLPCPISMLFYTRKPFGKHARHDTTQTHSQEVAPTLPLLVQWIG
jgi:hypothetical protein